MGGGGAGSKRCPFPRFPRSDATLDKARFCPVTMAKFSNAFLAPWPFSVPFGVTTAEFRQYSAAISSQIKRLSELSSPPGSMAA